MISKNTPRKCRKMDQSSIIHSSKMKKINNEIAIKKAKN